MEPRIQYAKTADGVSIAYWTLGEGPTLIQTPDIPISISAQWQVPELRAWYERLAEKRTVITYDARGLGLSERKLLELRTGYGYHDLAAVADALAVQRFVLLGVFRSTPYAIRYAARHPERVSRLILYSPVGRYGEVLSTVALSTILRMLEGDFESYLDTTLRVSAGLPPGERVRQLVSLVRQSVTQEMYRWGLDAMRELDVSDLLGRVQSPTLVVHRSGVEMVTVDIVREVVSTIPGARLNMLDGEVLYPWAGDAGAVLDAIESFLGEGEEATAAAAPSGLVTILFTDMVDSTALTQRLGDAKAQELLRTHNAIVRSALSGHGGSEIKHTGDGIMASFPSASGALQCAVAIQRAVAARMEEHPETPLGVHIGLNAGEPVAEEKDLFGTAVQLARRICDRAETGQILTPIVVRELAAGKGFLFADIGDSELRGFEDPVRLYEVRWRD